MKPTPSPTPPHRGQPLVLAGAEFAGARGAVVLLHGRGATAENILTLAPELDQADLVYLAPRAANHTWYPNSFMAPIPRNEPGISSGMAVIAGLLTYLNERGFPAEKIVLGGFSQGACLTLEFAARHARRYGGIIAFSGGLIGPPETPRNYTGAFAGTPVFLGCSDVDFHIPKERVTESAAVLEALGAEVDLRLYPGMGHTINDDEIRAARKILQAV